MVHGRFSKTRCKKQALYGLENPKRCTDHKNDDDKYLITQVATKKDTQKIETDLTNLTNKYTNLHKKLLDEFTKLRNKIELESPNNSSDLQQWVWYRNIFKTHAVKIANNRRDIETLKIRVSNIEKCILQQLINYFKIKFDNDNIREANAAEEDSWNIRTRVKGIFGVTGSGITTYGSACVIDSIASGSALGPLVGGPATLVMFTALGIMGASIANIISPGSNQFFSAAKKQKEKSLPILEEHVKKFYTEKAKNEDNYETYKNVIHKGTVTKMINTWNSNNPDDLLEVPA